MLLLLATELATAIAAAIATEIATEWIDQRRCNVKFPKSGISRCRCLYGGRVPLDYRSIRDLCERPSYLIIFQTSPGSTSQYQLSTTSSHLSAQNKPRCAMTNRQGPFRDLSLMHRWLHTNFTSRTSPIRRSKRSSATTTAGATQTGTL